MLLLLSWIIFLNLLSFVMIIYSMEGIIEILTSVLLQT